MPVISCPDCSRDVSTIAAACPHCGRPSPAGMSPLMTPPAPVREETLWKGTPSPTLLMGWVGGIVLTLVAIPLIVRFFASGLPSSEQFVRVGWFITAILTAIQVIGFLVAWIRLRSTQYTLTNQRVLIEQGVFSKTVDEIDLRYVDDSLFTQGLLDRILGIGNVTLLSSDKTSPRYMLRSIKDPRGVRELIRAEAYQNSQRQIFTRST
ncbi:MAG TPA: PH domain-containing protein [Thermoanaerobaculia bacterium]|nr:PH domain-containing protein [Thermoanaerobaculia bacterium]